MISNFRVGRLQRGSENLKYLISKANNPLISQVVFLNKECGSGLFQTMDFMKSLWLLCTAMHFVSKVLRSVLRIVDIYR